MLEKWIIPCNTSYFDVVDHFKKNDTVIWKTPASVSVNDIVYIYLGRPNSEIKYKCTVINENINKDILQNNSYAIRERNPLNAYKTKEKYVEMKLVYEYQSGQLSFGKLREHGLGQVQIPARANKKLIAYIETIEGV